MKDISYAAISSVFELQLPSAHFGWRKVTRWGLICIDNML